MITKGAVIEKISAYLNHKLTLHELVNWSENCMMEEDIDTADYNQIRDAIARLGVADVREFGLTWEDCENLLETLGYKAHIEIVSN